MSMKNRKILIENDDFIRLSRSIRTAYLDGLLLLDEMLVLFWLWINANPRTGRFMTSYESLSKDFQGRYSKNQINKFMLELKRKELIGFPRQQGRRGSFFVDIQNYPLSTGGFKDIEKDDEQESGRSSDNDNEKRDYNNNEKTISEYQKTDIRFPVSKYDPESYEEERCKEIAKYLGEKDMRFMISTLKNRGLGLIEEIYNEIKEKENSGKGKPIRNRGAYFNKRIQQMTQYD